MGIKSVVIDEEIYDRFRRIARSGGLSMTDAFEQIVLIAEMRIKEFIKNDEFPISEYMWVPLIDIYKGINLIDCGKISKKDFYEIIKNGVETGIYFYSGNNTNKKAAFAKYSGNEDMIDCFLEECCSFEDDDQVFATDLYEHFKKWWLIKVGRNVPSQKRFGGKLRSKFNYKKEGRYKYYGVNIKKEFLKS